MAKPGHGCDDCVFHLAQAHARIEFAKLLLQRGPSLFIRCLLQSLGLGVELVGQCLQSRRRTHQGLIDAVPLV